MRCAGLCGDGGARGGRELRYRERVAGQEKIPVTQPLPVLHVYHATDSGCAYGIHGGTAEPNTAMGETGISAPAGASMQLPSIRGRAGLVGKGLIVSSL